eukprot:CAMPEP_0201555850 /NCGR_PEP_ID=MMETSP0173_2-20130828/51701_1 /ASSEMBLY_ACC=CAM_ASM_000268 /TAXON_ID=218659 /ORGANISM="Vexillifera sp., Strain DIVA3 564/2" /LENGTH=30 /DNA_ID= /DNA_START= /DNA_END= /DNA_ORIENTATION=
MDPINQAKENPFASSCEMIPPVIKKSEPGA